MWYNAETASGCSEIVGLAAMAGKQLTQRAHTMNWHSTEATELFKEFGSSRLGLTSEQAEAQRLKYGPNILEEKKKKPLFLVFLDQFKDFMILVLIAAAVVAGIAGEAADTIAIIVIVFLNAVIGFVQEFRAEKAMEALKKMAEPMAPVFRNGARVSCLSSEIVPGDVVILEAGCIIPADMRLLHVAQLKVDESALTGESVPVDKTMETLRDRELPLGDRKNIAYRGTLVTYGRGLGLVVTTGMQTELGGIATLLQKEKEVRTPLQRRLERFGKRLAAAILAICAIVFVFGLARGVPPLLILLTAISLAVAAIPEALPAVITITLAVGAKKMVEQHALIRKLPAVEALGSVTYICSDKTGTLTMNRMEVEQLYAGGKRADDPGGETPRGTAPSPDVRPDTMLITALALNNDAQRDFENHITGDPTEVALYRAAEQRGFGKKELETAYARVGEIPFDSERKCMTTFHRWEDGTYLSLTKGAMEVILEKSESLYGPDGNEPVEREAMLKIGEEMAEQGLRVLAVAMRRWQDLPATLSPEKCENGLTFLGLAGMMDPPREEAGEAVRLCKAAGIKPVMITGDHPVTAATIARRLGIMEKGSDTVMTGRELAALSDKEFEGMVDSLKVYARMAPEQKLKIVKALQGRGEYVAMTGDGVNDAPALKRADIGVAMGVTGTDVAREACHMVLLDDNFATIVKAVKEGRKIYDNIRKFIKYLLATNSGEVWTLFLAPFLGLPLPLLPIQILWVNLMTDGLPALALSVEPEEGDVMERPPRRPGESIFAHGLGWAVLWIGLFIAGITLGTQAWGVKTGCANWQTMVFTVLCLSQLANVFAIRSEKKSLFKIGIFSNKFLIGAVFLSLMLQLAVVYLPPLNTIFKTSPLSAAQLLVAVLVSASVFFVVEADKWVRRMLRSTS